MIFRDVFLHPDFRPEFAYMPMQTIGNTTATGGRISSPHYRGSLKQSEEFEGLPEDVDRFYALKLIKKAGRDAGFNPELVQLLEYYLIRTNPVDWTEGNQPLCYQAVTTTAHDLDISERQVRNREKALNILGALTWEDSGNFKRFGVRDKESGQILYAFGVDMSPLAALIPSLEEKVQEKAEYKAAWNEKKRKISGYRARIRALLAESLLHKELTDIATTFQDEYDQVAYTIRTYHSLVSLEELAGKHQLIYQSLSEALEKATAARDKLKNTEVTSAREEEDCRHIHSTTLKESDKSDYSSRSDIAFQESVADPLTGKSQGSAGGEDVKEEETSTVRTGADNITLKQVLGASSERFKDHLSLKENTLHWDDIVEAAHSLLPELKINKSAWWLACEVMGRYSAAIAVMVIDQKAQDEEDPVHNPGGYLRAMTTKAKKGELNLQGSVWGFLKREREKYDA